MHLCCMCTKMVNRESKVVECCISGGIVRNGAVGANAEKATDVNGREYFT